MKRQKRYWTWTAAQKRKKYTIWRWGESAYRNAPKDYRRPFSRAEKAQAKRALLVEINGGIGNFPPRTHRGEAAWSYW